MPLGKPSAAETRTVYAYLRYPWDVTKAIPDSLDSPYWTPWVNTKPHDIETGLLAGMAAHRGFRGQGGEKMFSGPGCVDELVIDVIIFDPATHEMRGGKIIDCHRTSYRFLLQKIEHSTAEPLDLSSNFHEAARTLPSLPGVSSTGSQ